MSEISIWSECASASDSAQGHDQPRMMLISKELQRYAPIDAKKVGAGAFLTRHDLWLQPQVVDFLKNTGAKAAVDPFAGDGHMLNHMQAVIGIQEVRGFDINPSPGITKNDSLHSIPRIERAVFVTNPPYLAKHSAKRKRVWDEVGHHYNTSGRYDLYQVALDRCLESADHVVAILPETFVWSDYPKSRLRSISIIEDSMFSDTDCPVCVACFGPTDCDLSEVSVFKNDRECCSLGQLTAIKREPHKRIKIRFNDPEGVLALRAVDTHDANDLIRFMKRNQIDYPTHMVKESSRLITFFSVPGLDAELHDDLLSRANILLEAYRTASFDLALSPFKGNRRDGTRRRRLDYGAARSILEDAIDDVQPSTSENDTLF